MRKGAMLILAVLMAAAFSTTADAAKKSKRAAAKPAVYSGQPTPEARAKALKGIAGLFLPSAILVLYAHSPDSPYK